MRKNYLQNLSTFADVRRKFGNDGAVAAVSANNKVSSRELSADTAVLVHPSTTEWPYSSVPVNNCCVVTKPSSRNERAKVANWKRIAIGRE